MDSTEPGRQPGIRDQRGASPDSILLPKSMRGPAYPSPSREPGEEFLNGEDTGMLHCGNPQAEEDPGHQSLIPPPPLESSPRMPGGGGPGRGSGRFCF